MRLGGAGKRRDAIEPQVVLALRAFGATVIQLNGPAPVPDLIVGYRGRWFALEVKSGEKAGITKRQAEAWTNGQMAPDVVSSVDDALSLVGCGGGR